jgi:fatty-acyl-CoA synthase/long-chain acyl-CoA synthetase
MIISGGMNVYSTEVEDVVQRHPMVGQVVVIGLPDEDWGEAVTAFVVPAPGDFDPDAVLAFAKEELAKYKTPKRVIQIDAVPVTAYGKADKKALRKDYWGDHDRAIN